MMTAAAVVVGAGLAGSEAAWQLAERGIDVMLYEMRPVRQTAAHQSDRCAELVCSNSLGSGLPDRATGLLQEELRRLGSLLIRIADETRVPAGSALAVDREAFAAAVTARLEAHPKIHLHREEVTTIPNHAATIIATGPLTSAPLAQALAQLTGSDYLYFYDAIAPIIEAESINMDLAFRASRWGKNQNADHDDYINCPLNKEEYYQFVEALLAAEKIPLRDFEQEDPKFFERCVPVEVLASRGPDTLAFGPMRPVGLRDPRTGRRPYAVVQLRQDNLAASLYNLVGFQTNIRWGEQERILRTIPGLEQAEFVRLGQMHRNTFLNSPTLLLPTMQYRGRPDLFFAGQMVGAEGYVGNAATGLLAGLNLARLLAEQSLLTLPSEMMLGALCHYITHAAPRDFQPMKANFGIMPPLVAPPRAKAERGKAYSERSLTVLNTLLPDIQPLCFSETASIPAY